MPPPSFDHGGVESNIHGAAFIFLQAHDLGILRVGESGLYTRRDPDTVRGVDLYFISHERLAKRDRKLVYLDVAPDWITEVLSPSNRDIHVQEKITEYFAINVRMVWLVDPDERCVHVYRSLTQIRTFHENDIVTGEDVLPGFEIQVAKIFETK